MCSSSRRTLSYRLFAYILLTPLLLCGGVIGCEKSAWDHSLDSPDSLGQAVVDALNSADIAGLDRLRVQRAAYLEWVWPAFPASRPPSNFPGEFAWSNLNKKCNAGMKRWVAQYGGRTLTFVDIRFESPSQDYDRFRLLRGTVLTVRDSAGRKQELRILGSVIVKDTRYKLLSYKD